MRVYQCSRHAIRSTCWIREAAIGEWNAAIKHTGNAVAGNEVPSMKVQNVSRGNAGTSIQGERRSKDRETNTDAAA